ncbi:MAG: helix-turn-helix transcriptional regulator [Pirellulales bacterium]|nr:helix-turn-helix transcriptional regulator [Pirellulales bacterium]
MSRPCANDQNQSNAPQDGAGPAAIFPCRSLSQTVPLLPAAGEGNTAENEPGQLQRVNPQAGNVELTLQHSLPSTRNAADPASALSEKTALQPRRPLTKAERQVARLISLGCTVAEAGAILYRSPNTADNHKSSAMKKLEVHNLAEFTRRVIQLGVSPLDDELSPEEKDRKGQAKRSRRPRQPR